MTIFYNLGLLIFTAGLSRATGPGNLLRSWILPLSRRGRKFSWGFTVLALACVAYHGISTLIQDIHWTWVEQIVPGLLAHSLWYDLNSVLFEELIFRGILLYMLLRRLPEVGACLISAAAFGVYHWFTQGAWGNPVAMAVVFLVTGLMGYVFAFAYARTSSIALPFGLHLGWNLVNHTLFAAGPFGALLLRPVSEEAASLVSLLLYLAIPLIVLFLVNRRYPLSSKPH
ncbi:CPBP family intramembrane glutamic endopeptidase [Neolewinella litorea]|uniref:CPBP family intramembrane metalloprotease n=1 Tax=Neolewinella litorea TaxID=2562452 RepID=A0A4S4NM07_9BACT|nr:type II CAAX endopeptidase family protein [Neolewinella litorea]THH39391.1 CPBP family intramembrane metalloprotease [Neolewinella litorea]